MKRLLIFIFIIFGQNNIPIYSKLKTKEDADNFFNSYFIYIVKFVKSTYVSQKEFSKKGQVGEALKIGGLIQESSQIYRNLCKN